MCHLHELRELRESRRQRDVLALHSVRPAAPVPLLVGAAEGHEHLVGQPELLGEQSRELGVVGDHILHLAAAGQRELEPHPEAMERWVAGAQQSHCRRRPPQAPGLVVVLARLEGDVVPEPLRLLVCVRVAGDVDEQRRVVDDRPLLLVETEPLAEPQCDQALPQHVLHRLPEAEVDAERERGDELRQANLRAIRIAAHRAELMPGLAERERVRVHAG